MKRKLLLIAHHFPPYGGPRSRRWVRLIRHTARFYDYDVLTVRHAKGVGPHEALEASSIPENATTYRTYPGPLYEFSYRSLPPPKPGESFSPGSRALRGAFKRMFRSSLEALLVPDKMIEWLPWGYAAAAKLVKSRTYDAIISSAFPFTDHILAYLVHRRTSLPWIADFGDPWAHNPALPFPARRRILDRHLEAALLKRMDAVWLTTRETEESYRSHYPFLDPERTVVLPNGYDDAEFAGVVPERGRRFRIVYTGIFYESRGPKVLFDALAGLDLDYELLIAGDVPRDWVADARRRGLTENVVFLGHCPHARALNLQAGADVLLLLGWPEGCQVPAKLYEYIGARRPILAVRTDAGDVAARTVAAHRRGIVAENTVGSIASAIRDLHDLWKRGDLESRFELGQLAEYSVGLQAERWRDLVEAVVARKRAERTWGMRERP